jgi:hypothetical protein
MVSPRRHAPVQSPPGYPVPAYVCRHQPTKSQLAVHAVQSKLNTPVHNRFAVQVRRHQQVAHHLGCPVTNVGFLRQCEHAPGDHGAAQTTLCMSPSGELRTYLNCIPKDTHYQDRHKCSGRIIQPPHTHRVAPCEALPGGGYLLEVQSFAKGRAQSNIGEGYNETFTSDATPIGRDPDGLCEVPDILPLAIDVC